MTLCVVAVSVCVSRKKEKQPNYSKLITYNNLTPFNIKQPNSFFTKNIFFLVQHLFSFPLSHPHPN